MKNIFLLKTRLGNDSKNNFASFLKVFCFFMISLIGTAGVNAQTISGIDYPAAANGSYTYDGDRNGKPSWTNGSYYVYWASDYDGIWMIDIDLDLGNNAEFYILNNSDDLPPTSGWTNGTGSGNPLLSGFTISSGSAPTASDFSTSPGPYQNVVYVFSTSDFGYSDADSDPLDHVRITAIPASGTLYLDADDGDDYDGGEEISNGDHVSKADLDAGNLQYITSGTTNTSFTFDVNDGTDYSSSTYTATLNVIAEPTVTLSVGSGSIDETGGSTTVTATLSHVFGATVTTSLAFSGTATYTDDYTRTGTSIAISSGTTGSITISSASDVIDEDDETVIVDINEVTNGSENGTQQKTITITDDDAAPAVAFNTTASSGSESVSSADLQVDLSAVSGLDVTVDYTVTGTATGGGTDYTLADGTLTISAGDANDNITITGIVDDLLDETNETVIVTLSAPSNATLGTNAVHTYTITDDDAAPAVAFNTTASSGSESVSSADLQVDLSAVSGLDVTVDYTVTGTATGGGTDYTLADGTLTISAGDANDNITITGIVDDLLDETNETVIVTLSAPSNATLGTNTVHTYTITDDDAAPAVAFNTTASSGSESVNSADLQVDLSAVSGLDVTVDYTVTGTATGGGTDYTLADGTLTISAGDANDNITITGIVDDLLDETDETVIVTLSAPSNATLGINTVHTYTIIDNDLGTGVDDALDNRLTVYPNPFTNRIYINGLNDEVSHITITNITGQVVMDTGYKGKEELDVEHLKYGVYFLILENRRGIKQVFKIVKQ